MPSDKLSTDIPDVPKKTPNSFLTIQLGIWEVVYASRSHFPDHLPRFPSHIDWQNYSLSVAFLQEIYSIAPYQLLTFVLTQLWESIETVLYLYCDAWILDDVCISISILIVWN